MRQGVMSSMLMDCVCSEGPAISHYSLEGCAGAGVPLSCTGCHIYDGLGIVLEGEGRYSWVGVDCAGSPLDCAGSPFNCAGSPLV